jgi:hypothetical protein
MPVKSGRVTHRTDSHGHVREEFNGLFERQALEMARNAGIPALLLDRGGWVEGDESLRGFWAECVYFLGDMLSGLERDISRVAIPIEYMQRMCAQYGVNPRDAIPYEAARFLRQRKERYDEMASINRGEELPLASESEVCWGQW